jgi:hypothetical protein
MFASLQNPPGQDDVLIHAGVCRAKPLAPGATMTCTFTYEEREASDGAEAFHGGRMRPLYRFDLRVGDSERGGVVTQRISFERTGTAPLSVKLVPPAIAVSAPLIVNGPTVSLTGEATSETGLRDLFVMVEPASSTRGGHKIFYAASSGDQARLPFSVPVPVERGSNLVSVIARGADGTKSTRQVLVERTQ